MADAPRAALTLRRPRIEPLARFGGLLALGLVAFALVLLVFGRNPLRAYVDIFASTLGSAYGFSETLVKVTPLLLTALAVAVPARIWLINVGGEGQLFMGALGATWAALHLADWPRLPLLAAMALLGFAAGGAWAAVAGVLRARGWASETISTLLLNYVAILLVQYVVFGPWRDPEGLNYPQTAAFAEAAILPALPGSRVHAGLLLGVLALAAFAFVVARTRWGSPRCPRSPCSRTPRWATRGATRAPAAWRWTGPRRGTTRRGRSRGWASRCRRWMPRWGRCRAATSSAPCWPASWPTRRG